MRRLICIALFVLGVGSNAVPPAPEGPVTDYTRWLEKTEREWTKGSGPAAGFAIECFQHPEKKFYVGTKTTGAIAAPLARVEKVFDEPEHFNDIFFGFEDIQRRETRPDGFTVFWHRAVPVFFIPDLRYEVVYRNDKTRADRKSYRYQLKSPIDLLKGLDGLIELEATGPATTRLTQYLFLDGKYGPLETFDPKKIWTDAVRDVALANLGVKTRAEHPDLARPELRAAIQKAYDAATVEKCIETKTLHPGLKAETKGTP